ncbi:cytochrome P450 [Periconia macrospinosa]|uniref:Cytochrome P450 n=1 Tax=Periconia macrospinosa TaxID=97972 RepID=A0A2V1DUW3_9PLEO|nr:cytochrome P450 [Periconia macrospinosa]
MYDSEYPIALPTPGPYYIHVFSKSHIEELSQAPEDTLSLHAFSKDLLQAKYTMDGLEFNDNMSENGAVHSRVLGVLLKSHLDELQPMLQETISTATAQYLNAGSHHAHQQWTEVNSFDFASGVVTHANALVFFGPELASDPAFIDIAMRYPKDLFVTAELLRFLPERLRPCAARALKKKFDTPGLLVSYLMPFVQRRVDEVIAGVDGQHRDLVQFFIESSRRKMMWSTHRIVQVILGIWFASVHQPALTMVNIIEDLHAQPEAWRCVQEELDALMNQERTMGNIDHLPLLDSFLKESARLHPSDSITARRKAVKPFAFSDGTMVEKDDVVCIPLEALMRDQRYYTHSQHFDAYRHMNKETGTSRSRFSEPSQEFPLWGLGRHACPGRHYSSRLLKLMVAHFASEYDIETAGDASRQARFFSWRTSILPGPGCKLRIRRKAIAP